MSSESRLTTGELAYLSETSRNSLVKAAEIRKEAAGKPWFSKDLVDYVLPTAIGAGTTAYGLHEGQDPRIAFGEGGGAALFSSPRGWKNLAHKAKASPDPITTFGRGVGKAMVYKGAPIAAGAGLTYLPPIFKGVKDIVQSMANTTGNADKITGALAAQSQPMAKGIVDSMQGMQDTMETIKSTTANLANAGKATGPAINEAAKSIGGAADAIKTVPDAVSSGVNKAVIGGLAGGGGLLLLHHLLKQREEKKKQQQAPVLQ